LGEDGEGVGFVAGDDAGDKAAVLGFTRVLGDGWDGDVAGAAAGEEDGLPPLPDGDGEIEKTGAFEDAGLLDGWATVLVPVFVRDVADSANAPVGKSGTIIVTIQMTAVTFITPSRTSLNIFIHGSFYDASGFVAVTI
jgi:hypothetical protein